MDIPSFVWYKRARKCPVGMVTESEDKELPADVLVIIENLCFVNLDNWGSEFWRWAVSDDVGGGWN